MRSTMSTAAGGVEGARIRGDYEGSTGWDEESR